MKKLTELELVEVAYWINLLNVAKDYKAKQKLIYFWTAGHLITSRQHGKLCQFVYQQLGA